MKKLWLPFLLLTISTLLFTACKKNYAEEKYTETINPVIPDFVTKINSGVAGFVTDEQGNAIAGADVKGGDVTTVTDKFGYFRIKTASFAKTAGFVKVIKPGYFAGYKTFMPRAGKQAFVRFQLIPEVIIGSVDASSGGTVITGDGAKVILPANAVVNASTNDAYSGTVNISVHWLNPAERKKTLAAMPGDLRGINKDGQLQSLITYGMMAAELTGSSGELLQIAPGKKASLHFPLPSAIAGTSPATIPLWYFDETKGLWKQEGSAVKNGDSYEGDVAHFSYWNCDAPSPLVNFKAQLLDDSLHPIKNAQVLLTLIRQDTASVGAIGFTDEEGYTEGMIPANSNFSFEFPDECGNAILIQNFSSLNAAIDLGSVKLILPRNSVYIHGIANKCDGTPVTDGYAIISGAGYVNASNITNGSFSISSNICLTSSVYVNVIDKEASQQSNPQSFTLTEGDNNAGVLKACNTIETEYIEYSINSTAAVRLTLPQYMFDIKYFDTAAGYTTFNVLDLLNADANVFTFNFHGPALPGTYEFMNGQISYNSELFYFWGGSNYPSSITVTSYGLIGQFIIGAFSGTVAKNNVPYPVTGSFKVKRDY